MQHFSHKTHFPVDPPQHVAGRRRSTRAQAMVEFALALPVFLLVVYGLLEVGRLVFLQATVITATREAVRYASTWGRIGNAQYQQFQDCAGIRRAAVNAGFLLGLSGTTNNNIHIYFDDAVPVQKPLYEYCTTSGQAIDTTVGESGSGAAHIVDSGDRIRVTVNVPYQPILPFFLPITPRTLTSTAYRTALGIIDLATPTP